MIEISASGRREILGLCVDTDRISGGVGEPNSPQGKRNPALCSVQPAGRKSRTLVTGSGVHLDK